ncbi:MAG TPA: phosphatidate cytidylyltransferase [Acidimicrobiales bacterium]|nr:phosphatidate cytidylyltransferase [Acidimicrobiales bacterium]
MDPDNEQGETPEAERKRLAGDTVRIIGADEAAAALQSGQAAGRRPEDAPRFGDVPRSPEGPRPAHRFPLPDSVDPSRVLPGHEDDAAASTHPGAGGTLDLTSGPGDDRYQDGYEDDYDAGYGEEAAPAGPAVEEPRSGPLTLPSQELPHWTEPATGEVPAVLASAAGTGGEDDMSAWSGLGRGARWRDRPSDWDESDFDDGDVLGEDLRVSVPDEDPDEELFAYDYPPDEEAPPAPPRRRVSSRPRRPTPVEGEGGRPAGRTRVVTGLAIGIVVLGLLKAGPAPTLALAVVVAVMAAAEVFHGLRRAAGRPAALLGLVATAAAMIGAYAKGETALPLVVAMTVVFAMLWYLAGVVRARPVISIGSTLFGFLWVGFLGSFAGLLLNPNIFPSRHGVAFLLGSLIGTVGYDVGGFVIGSQFGRHPMAPTISPAKTWEGLVGGMLTALLASAIMGGFIHPWTFRYGVALGLVVAVAAPLGDLCQSMVKRDLGLKDMGSLLPGHGGVLDRIDAVLFVLPATYYLVRVLGIG